MSTTTCIFDRKKKATRQKPGVVEIRFTYQRKSYYISTGIRLRMGEWALNCVTNRPDEDSLNERLRRMLNRANAEVDRRVDGGLPIDVAEIRAIVISEKEHAMADVCADEVGEWIEGQLPLLGVRTDTLKHYKTVLTRVRESAMLRRWSDLTTERLYEWDAWLHALKGKDGGRISDGGVFTYHKCLKALLNRAVLFGKVDRNPYDKVRGKFKRGDKHNVEYLTEDEMEAFMSLRPVAGTQMAVAKDLFVFQMFTGLAYSDMRAFSLTDYKKIDGRWVNMGERIKTGVAYVSQLLPPVVEVLERYGWRLPVLDNADYNHALKLLGQAAGIATPLHSHLARHTFATWMLRNGAKIENVSKMLGHTNITQTQRYAKVLAQSVYEDFDRMEKKLAASGAQRTEHKNLKNEKKN